MNEEVLQDFLIREDDWLQNLWLPKGKFENKSTDKSKKLFDLESKTNLLEDSYFELTEYPKEIYDKLLKAINEQRINLKEQDEAKIQKAIKSKAARFNLYEGDIPDPPNKCKKIYFNPDNELKELLNNCFGWSRWAYNESVTIINNWFNDTNPEKEKLTIGVLKRLVLSDNENVPLTYYGEYYNLNSENGENNYNIKESEVRKAFTAYKNILKLLADKKKKNESLFKPHLEYRKKKQMNKETFTFYHRNTNNIRGIYFKIFSKIKTCLVSDNYSLDDINYDFTVTKTNTCKYYVCIPCFNEHIKVAEKKDNFNIVAIDPGVRTPFTCYDPAGEVTKISEGRSGLLYKLLKKRDNTISRRDKIKKSKLLYSECKTDEEKKEHRKQNKKIRRITKAVFKIQNRIDNLRKEFHYSAIKFLVHNYDVILIPEFGGKGMISKKKSKLAKITKRQMLSWGHYSFRMRLVQKAKEKGCLVIFVDESFTTMTCGYCAQLNKVGKVEVLKCTSCKMTLDRDVNASRNIYIKYLAKVTGSSAGSVA
jgi:transposase